jgi:NADH dehydrogenase (ubiquinone) 1 beta subcomplex subunit 9
LYKRYLTNELNWCIRRDVWRDRAIEIRAEVSLRSRSRERRGLLRVRDSARS